MTYPPKPNRPLVIRDHRTGHWYYINNLIQDHYRPLIGSTGMDLYNLYARRSFRRDESVAIPHEIIISHLGISKSTLIETNYILEWCGLIHIVRRYHQVNHIYLLDPQPITPERLEQIRAAVQVGCASRRLKNGRQTKGYLKLLKTMEKHLDEWYDLNEHWAESTKNEPEVIKAGELAIAPEAEPDDEVEFTVEVWDLVDQITEILVSGGSKAEAAQRQAAGLVKQYGAEVCARQLACFEQRCQLARESERGLASPAGLLVKSIKEDWAPLSTPAEKSWYTPDESALIIR